MNLTTKKCEIQSVDRFLVSRAHAFKSWKFWKRTKTIFGIWLIKNMMENDKFEWSQLIERRDLEIV